MKEIWKPILKFPEYKVSTLGRIEIICGNIHFGTPHPAGYLVANLYKKGKNHRRYIQRLIRETFIGEIPEGYVINHLDGNRINNRLDNLDCITRADNVKHGNSKLAFGIKKPKWIEFTGNLPDEIWQPVSGYENFYEVSNLGRIKILLQKFCKEWIRAGNVPYDKLSSPSLVARYYKVCLSGRKGFKKWFSVARLVGDHYVPNPNNLPIINHKDGNKLNDRADNLEWGTQSDNMLHSYKDGPRKTLRGSQIGNSKLTDQDVRDIREIWSKGRISQYKLGEIFGLSQCHVSDIVNKKRWAHV